MISLLDVNVLLALIWPNNAHHASANAWFAKVESDGWATCAITEAGFVRISCNPAVVQRRVTPNEAIRILRELETDPHHTYLPLNRSLTQLPPEIRGRLTGHRQITDAILLMTAMEHQCQLVTFDVGLASLAPEQAGRRLLVIPA